jgi:hypothetical protein
MTELKHRAGRWLPVTLSNEKAPSPIRAWSHLHPPDSGRLGAAHGQRTADFRSRSQPAWPLSHYLDPMTGSVRSR